MSHRERLPMLASGDLADISHAAQAYALLPAEYLSFLARRRKIKAFKLNRDWFTTNQTVFAYLKKQTQKHRVLASRLNSPVIKNYVNG